MIDCRRHAAAQQSRDVGARTDSRSRRRRRSHGRRRSRDTARVRLATSKPAARCRHERCAHGNGRGTGRARRTRRRRPRSAARRASEREDAERCAARPPWWRARRGYDPCSRDPERDDISAKPPSTVSGATGLGQPEALAVGQPEHHPEHEFEHNRSVQNARIGGCGASAWPCQTVAMSTPEAARPRCAARRHRGREQR